MLAESLACSVVLGHCSLSLGASVSKDHKRGGLRQPELISSVLEARSPKSRGVAGAPSQGSWGESFLPLAASGGSSCPLTCEGITLTSASVFECLLCISVSSPLSVRTPLIRFSSSYTWLPHILKIIVHAAVRGAGLEWKQAAVPWALGQLAPAGPR